MATGRKNKLSSTGSTTLVVLSRHCIVLNMKNNCVFLQKQLTRDRFAPDPKSNIQRLCFGLLFLHDLDSYI
eukprot:g14459.t1